MDTKATLVVTAKVLLNLHKRIHAMESRYVSAHDALPDEELNALNADLNEFTQAMQELVSHLQTQS